MGDDMIIKPDFPYTIYDTVNGKQEYTIKGNLKVMSFLKGRSRKMNKKELESLISQIADGTVTADEAVKMTEKVKSKFRHGEPLAADTVHDILELVEGDGVYVIEGTQGWRVPLRVEGRSFKIYHGSK